MAAAVSQNNKNVAFKRPGCLLFIMSLYYLDDLSNNIHCKLPEQIICWLSASFRSQYTLHNNAHH